MLDYRNICNIEYHYADSAELGQQIDKNRVRILSEIPPSTQGMIACKQPQRSCEKAILPGTAAMSETYETPSSLTAQQTQYLRFIIESLSASAPANFENMLKTACALLVRITEIGGATQIDAQLQLWARSMTPAVSDGEQEK